MKRFRRPLLIASLALFSCTGRNSTGPGVQADDSNAAVSMTASADRDSAFIPVDTANVMLSSYLNSIDAANNDTDLRSVIFDANALRDYLTSDTGRSISHLKVMFAHRMSYIDKGNTNIPCGYRSEGLTFILAGYNDSGNYVYFPGDRVENNGGPCPHTCPTAGTAANDQLIR